MIYLKGPFPIINGVSLMPDHEDPNWFYYMPLAPRLTQALDAGAGQKVPQLQLLKFRGTAGSGGFLNFDCNVGIDGPQLDDIAEELKRMMHLRETPKLGPLPLVGGTVRLLLLGASTPDQPASGGKPAAGSSGSSGGSSSSSSATAAAAAAGPKFVTRIDQSAHPALYGDNQATFSVALDAPGVTVLEQALQGEMSPIGIVYSLDYLGLRPAYNVHLHIDWDRVQKSLDEQFGASFIFFSSQIDTAVDKLVENRAIQMEVDTFVPEGEDDSSVIASRDRAVQEVREMITNAFFQPSIDPTKQGPDGWDKAGQFAERLSGLAATGGLGGCFSYKKTDYTRIDKKMLDVNMSERTTVRRSIYPQGHLAGLFQVLRDQHLDLNRFVVPVNLDDPWFQRRQVNVISRANFDEDSVNSLNVQLRYGNDGKSVLLEPNHLTDKVDWASNLDGSSVKRDVSYQYTVSFKSVDGTQRPPSIDSPLLNTQTDNLEIDPRRLYSIIHVPITAVGFPWQKYPTVQVQVRYTDEQNGLREQQSFLLNSDRTSQDWKVFVLNRQSTTFEYKLIFRGADGHDLEKAWVSTDQQQIIIRAPFPSSRKVDVVANVSWDKVQNVFVDLFYDDPADNISQQSSLSFSKTDPMPKSFSVEMRDPSRRRVAYESTVLFTDGRMVQVPRSYTLDARIIVRSDSKGHKIVNIRPQAADFADLKIKQIVVQAKYEDLGNGLSFAGQSVLTKPESVGTFEFDYVDPNQSKYSYQASVQFTNGLSRDTDWQTSDDADLVIAVM